MGRVQECCSRRERRLGDKRAEDLDEGEMRVGEGQDESERGGVVVWTSWAGRTRKEWSGRKRGSFADVLSEIEKRGVRKCGARVSRARIQTAHREATAVRPLEQRGAVPSPWESPVKRHTNPSRLQGAPTADELSLMLRGLLIRLSALDGQLEDNRGACGLTNCDSISRRWFSVG